VADGGEDGVSSVAGGSLEIAAAEMEQNDFGNAIGTSRTNRSR
jgi:hypothetical protein